MNLFKLMKKMCGCAYWVILTFMSVTRVFSPFILLATFPSPPFLNRPSALPVVHPPDQTNSSSFSISISCFTLSPSLPTSFHTPLPVVSAHPPLTTPSPIHHPQYPPNSPHFSFFPCTPMAMTTLPSPQLSTCSCPSPGPPTSSSHTVLYPSPPSF